MRKKAHVVLYTRPGCHLCDEAKQEILSATCADEYEMEEINIDSDPALRERYRYEIPVITINGIKAFKHRLTADEFRKAVKRRSQESEA